MKYWPHGLLAAALACVLVFYSARAAGADPDFVVINPPAVDQKAGTITIRIEDYLRLVQMNNYKVKVINRLEAELARAQKLCRGVQL